MPSEPRGKDSKLRILIIDDEPVIKEVLEIAFGEAGWEVTKADTGEEGLRRLRESSYDVIVVDKNLPGMSGVDFIREVRKQNRVIRILLITAYGSVESAIETLNLGIDAYLEKPFPSVYDVVRAVRAAMDRFNTRWLDVPAEEAKPAPLSGLGALARASSGRPLRLVLGSPDETFRQRVMAHLELRDRVEQFDATQGVLAAVTQGQHDAVIIDTAFGVSEVLELVEALAAASPKTQVILFADTLPLETIRRFIELRVQAVIARTAESGKLRRRLLDVLAQIRRLDPRR